VTDHDRISQLDGIRAFAFTMVFVHHGLHVPLLWMGVDLFFVLSGFLITRNLLAMRAASAGSALATFYFRRVLRIIPPYYLALVLIALASDGAQRGLPWFFGFASNIHDALYGPSDHALNPMWSIAVEEQFYLVWPWIVLFVPARALCKVFIALICAAPIARILLTPYGYDAVYRLTPCRMDLLAVGALLAIVDARSPRWFAANRRWSFAVSAIAIALFAAISLRDPTFRTSLDEPLFNVVGFGLSAVVFTCVLVIARGTTSGPLFAVLTHPVAKYVGKISYMAYLTHVLGLELAARATTNRIATAVLGLTITLALATVSWYVLEAPLQRLRRLVTTRPRAAT
jgi:peptidoglycan/LPS O-acetylase OafA/YrhL